MCHILRRNFLLKQFIEGKKEGKIEVTRKPGRICKQLLDGLKEKRGHWKMNGEALARTVQRIRFGGSYGPVVRPTAEWMKPGGT